MSPPEMPTPPRRRPVAAVRSLAIGSIAAVLALGLGACGGGDDSSSTASVTNGDAAAPTELSAGDFILELEADKQAHIEEVVAATPECEGLEADHGFLLLVTAKATDLPPDEPINPVITDACTP